MVNKIVSVSSRDTDAVSKSLLALKEKILNKQYESFRRLSTEEFKHIEFFSYTPKGSIYLQLVLPDDLAKYYSALETWQHGKCSCRYCQAHPRAKIEVRAMQCMAKPVMPPINGITFWVHNESLAFGFCRTMDGIKVYKLEVCVHEWVEILPPRFNCYHEYECKKCGGFHAVDSSD